MSVCEFLAGPDESAPARRDRTARSGQACSPPGLWPRPRPDLPVFASVPARAGQLGAFGQGEVLESSASLLCNAAS